MAYRSGRGLWRLRRYSLRGTTLTPIFSRAPSDGPSGDRPRERLLREGATALSTAELLAIIFRVGVGGENVISLSQRLLAKYGYGPLAEAKVVVEEVKGNPGYYTSKFYLRPHYQLEGLTVSLRLVSRVPSGK